MSLEKNFKCDLCDKIFETRSGVWKHKNIKHVDEIVKIVSKTWVATSSQKVDISL